MMIAVAGVDGERLEKPHVEGLRQEDKCTVLYRLQYLMPFSGVALIRF
jgi:hypothetical protein